MSADKRAAWIQGLRQVLDVLEGDESIPLPHLGVRADVLEWYVHGSSDPMTGERLAAMVRALSGEQWQQKTSPSSSSSAVTWLTVTGRIAGIGVEINADADQVCEPIDPQPVIERHCPALDAFLAGQQEGGDQ